MICCCVDKGTKKALNHSTLTVTPSHWSTNFSLCPPSVPKWGGFCEDNFPASDVLSQRENDQFWWRIQNWKKLARVFIGSRLAGSQPTWRACVDATLIRLSMEGAEQLPEWLRAPRQRRNKMAAIVHFLPNSASVTSRIEQFEHLTGSSGSRLASSTRTMLGSSSSMSMRPLSVPVPCSQRFSATESRQGIHFDDTSSESESPSKDFLLLLCWLFCQNWIFHLDQFCLQIQEWWTIINHFFDGDPWHFTTYKLMKSSDNFFCKNEILSRARSHNLMIDVSWGERGSLECQDLRDFQWFLRSHGYSIDNVGGFIDLEFELLFKKEASDSKERYYLFHWYWINLQLVWNSIISAHHLSKELWLSNLAAIYCSFVKLIFGHRHCDIFLEKVQLCNKK